MVTLGTDRLVACFVDVVTVIAKRLPVVHAPEQRLVAFVRNAMVNERGNQRATFAQVLAPRVYGEERFAFFPPPMVVPALVCSRPAHGASHLLRRRTRSHHAHGLRRNRSRATNRCTVSNVRSPSRLDA